jgi:hypothetical protein
MYKRFTVLLGIFLGSHAPTAGQTPAPHLVLSQEHGPPIITMLRTESTPFLTASFVLNQDPGKSPAHFNPLFAIANERDHSVELFPPMEQVKTLFFTHLSVPVVQLWGGRLQLDAFQNTLHIQNVRLGPLGMLDFRRPRQSYPGGPLSVHLSGFSLSFHFGRGSRTGRPAQVWRSLSRIVGTVLN